MRFADYIKVNEGFQTSINLEYDLNRKEKVLKYIPTEQSVSVLGTYLKSFYYNNDTQSRATVLVGPYGRGKSHLLLVLSALTSMDTFGADEQESKDNLQILKKVCERISSVDSEVGALAFQVVEAGIRTLPIVINSNTTDINQAFLVAINEALSRAGLKSLLPNTYFDSAFSVIQRWESGYPDAIKKLAKELKNEKSTIEDLKIGLLQYSQDAYHLFCRCYTSVAAGTEFNPLTNMDVVKLYLAVTQALCEQTDYSGINIIFDEFSKFLEANLDRSKMLNFKIIQDMAEVAARSGQQQIHFTCVTHKDILDYSSSDSFKTVEGRFRKIQFISSSEQNYELIANALEKSPSFSAFLEEHKKAFDEVMTTSSADVFNDMPREAYQSKVVFGCFPLAPLSAFALLHISELVGQNERTLFTFLAQNSEGALPAFLEQERIEISFITMDQIYDYFEGLLKKEVFNPRVHSVWAKADSALKQIRNSIEIKVVKAIAVINIIGDDRLKPVSSHIKAALLLDDISFSAAATALQKKHILSQRDSSEYVLLTANGVDIQKSIDNQVKTKIPRINVAEILNSKCALPIVMPREYNDTFCMMRFFRQVYMEASTFVKYKNANQLLSEYDCDGIILHIIESDDACSNDLLSKIKAFKKAPHIILCRSKLPFTSEDMLKRLVAAEQMKKTEIYLQDPHYSEELIVFEEDLIRQVESILGDMFSPSSKYSYYQNCDGELHISKQADLSHEASKICDAVYCSTPKINNEMVNKRVLNSQNLKGRDIVVDWVLAHSDDAVIPCMDGYGPETSIFKSAFRFTGLDSASHVADEGINDVLSEIYLFISSCELHANNFGTLYQTLTMPPFGMRKGVIPLFIAYALRTYKENVILYFKGKEVELSAQMLSNINETPENYLLLIEAGTKARDNYLLSLEELFLPYAESGKNSLNKVYSVVRSMQNWIRSLPEYTKKFHLYYENGEARIVGSEVDTLRNELLKFEINARELLFTTLPATMSDVANYDTCIEAIRNTKYLLDNHISLCRSELIKKLTALFVPGYQGGLSHSVKSWYRNLPEATKVHLFDNNTKPLLSIAENHTSYNDDELFDAFVMAFTSIAVEDWNDERAKHFVESITTALNKISDYKEEPQSNDTLGRVMISAKGLQFEKTFEPGGISPLGKTVLNNLLSVFEEYNDAIEPDEQLAIIVKLIGDVIL